MCGCSSSKGLDLLAAQTETQDVSCLPALRVSDVAPTMPVTLIQTGSAGTAPCPCGFAFTQLKVSLHVFEPTCDICPCRGCSHSALRAAHQWSGLLPSHV